MFILEHGDLVLEGGEPVLLHSEILLEAEYPALLVPYPPPEELHGLRARASWADSRGHQLVFRLVEGLLGDRELA